jgi:hypothetical protein
VESSDRPRESALELARLFRNQSSREPLTEDMHSWIYEAFGRILEGEDPAKAFGFKRARGEREHYDHDPLALAASIEKQMRNGKNKTEAISATAELFSRDEQTIGNAVRGITLDEKINDIMLSHLIQKALGNNQ